jgi:hypothetical protein
MTATNILNAVMAGKDGALGIQKAKIGDLLLDCVTGIRPVYRKEVTRRPVQTGFTVDVGVLDTPFELELDIVLANPAFSPENLVGAALTGNVAALTKTWREKRDELFALYNDKTIVDVTTHDQSYSPLVIYEITPQYDVEMDVDGWIGTVHLIAFNNQGGDTALDLADASTAATVAGGAL